MLNSAKRVETIELSLIRKMFEVTNPDAVNLGIGEPDFDVPQNIKDAMKVAIDEGYTKYTSNKGLIELREAIVEKLAKDNNIKTDAENVIVTCGASESLYAAAQALFEKGDNVLVPNPGFLSYYTCVQLAEANVVEVTTPMENEFKMKVEDVQERIDKNTKGLIINSPSNPTGAVMDKEDIKGIADLATDHDFYIISDEIYEKITYGTKNHSPAEYCDNVVTINGFSKTYAMTGLRVGYMVANDDVTENLLKVHQYCTANAPSVSQVGAIEALTGPQDSVKKMVAEFSRRRDLIVSSLNDMGYEEKYIRYQKGIADEANEAQIRYPIRLKVGMYQIRKEDSNIDLMIDRANAARKSIDITANVFTATYSDNIISNMRKVDAIESEMENSLKKGEFRLFIQPKWDTNKDECLGGEAFVRWIKNDGSMVYPSDFIPIFESNGFIENLDFYMLEQLCIKMKEMRKDSTEYRFFPVSVNQSRVLINNPDYVKNVEKILKRYDTDVSLIQLEITENLFFDQREKMVEVINQLKKLGLELAMDDFGSGYSSLNILKDVPFDILKIDKEFFDETITSNASTVILRKIFEMATELNIDVICEGVETKEQVEMLKGFGCHAVQGYYYGKPMPVDEFIEKYCVIKK